MHKSAIAAMFLAVILITGTFTILSPSFILIDTEAAKDKTDKKYEENNYEQSKYREYDEYDSDDYQYYENFNNENYYNNYDLNDNNIYETDNFNSKVPYKDPYSKDINDNKKTYSGYMFDGKKKSKSSDNDYDEDYFPSIDEKYVKDKKSQKNQKKDDKRYIEKKYKGDSFEFEVSDGYPDYKGKYQEDEKKSKYNKGNEYINDEKKSKYNKGNEYINDEKKSKYNKGNEYINDERDSYVQFGTKHNFGKDNLGLKDKDPIDSCETCYLFYMDFLTRDELAVAYMELLNTLNQNGASLDQITNENDIPLFNSANIWEICEAISSLLSSGQDKSRILAGLLLDWADNIQQNIVSNQGIVRDVNGDNIGLVILAIIDCIAEQNHVKLQIQPSDITAHNQSIKSIQSNNKSQEESSVNINEAFSQNITKKQNEIITSNEDNNFQQHAQINQDELQGVQNLQQENNSVALTDNQMIQQAQQKQTQVQDEQQRVQNLQQENTRMGSKPLDINNIIPSFPNIMSILN